jgi:hypothetical protein
MAAAQVIGPLWAQTLDDAYIILKQRIAAIQVP